MLLAFFEPCLSHRDNDAKSKDEKTSVAPLDDHMTAAHGSHVSVTHRVSMHSSNTWIPRLRLLNFYFELNFIFTLLLRVPLYGTVSKN